MPSTTGQVYLGSSLINNLRFHNNSDWTRPASWIAMPTITSTEQKVSALFLVGDNDSNFVAFRFSGNYTVDWGDGNIENVYGGVTAEHNYVFSSLSASTEIGPVGSKMRQAMIVITPQAGQNLTSVSFDFRHSSLSGITYTTPIIEITLSAPNCTTLTIGGTTGNLRLLDQCTILSHNTISASNMFNVCASLKSIPLFDTSYVTNMANMFTGCASLQSIPLFDTSSAQNMTNMFSGCSTLQSVPLFNISSVTTMSNMFNGCSMLQSVPLFNTSSAINMGSMFNGCRSLQSIPNFNCSRATTSSFFALNCNGLKRCQATGIKSAVSFANCSLSASSLNEIYANLADLTALPTQTITVTGNYGIATDNPAIATEKNWTVVG
jgi:surface protein